MKMVLAKLGNMKKVQEFIVYPAQAGLDTVKIQSDKRICVFDPVTGKGVLSAQKQSGAYGVHLYAPDAMPVEVPKEVIEQVMSARPKKGDVIGPGVTVG